MTALDTVEVAADVVPAFVSNNPVPRGELPALIQIIHNTLARLSGGVENPAPKEESKEPAVSIRKSITPEYLVCLEDGKHFKSLKRHLVGHSLVGAFAFQPFPEFVQDQSLSPSPTASPTPDQYRAKWKLPSDYPMVAPNYAHLLLRAHRTHRRRYQGVE